MRQVIEVLLENKPGTLMRVAGILSATGTNIDELSVSPDPRRPALSRMTITATIEPRLRRRVVQQMNRLVNVITAATASEAAGAMAERNAGVEPTAVVGTIAEVAQ